MRCHATGYGLCCRRARSARSTGRHRHSSSSPDQRADRPAPAFVLRGSRRSLDAADGPRGNRRRFDAHLRRSGCTRCLAPTRVSLRARGNIGDARRGPLVAGRDRLRVRTARRRGADSAAPVLFLMATPPASHPSRPLR